MLVTRERKQRLCDLRRQIFYLWKLAHTPLAYRSRFWMVFDGTGFLHLAIHEDEILKLWKVSPGGVATETTLSVGTSTVDRLLAPRKP